MRYAKLFVPIVTTFLLLCAVNGSAQIADVWSGPLKTEFSQNTTNVLFDFDDHIIDTQGEQGALRKDAEWLKAHPDVRFYVNGYCDERGDILYNMTLSQKRADAVTSALLQLGVSQNQIISSVGWGKLYPTCAGDEEGCREKNRVVQLVYAAP